MISMLNQYGVIELVCDTPEDIANINTNAASGSTCFVISTAEVYMLNGQREWVKL